MLNWCDSCGLVPLVGLVPEVRSERITVREFWVYLFHWTPDGQYRPLTEVLSCGPYKPQYGGLATMHLTFVHIFSNREIIDGPNKYWSYFCIAYWGCDSVFRIIAVTLEDLTCVQPNLLDCLVLKAFKHSFVYFIFRCVVLVGCMFKVVLFLFGLKRLLWNRDPCLVCRQRIQQGSFRRDILLQGRCCLFFIMFYW